MPTNDFLNRLHVRVDGVVFHAVTGAEGNQFSGGACGEGLGRFGDGAGEGAAVGLFEERLSLDEVLGAVANQLGDLFGVEVDVGDRGEEAVNHEVVDAGILGALFTSLVGPEGDSFHGVNQQVLQCRDVRLLAAHAYFRATAVSCLLTLIAKHVLHFCLLGCLVSG